MLRQHGTERPGTSPLNAEKRPGTFVCAGCGHPLFDAGTKFESGTGWPSFWAPKEEGVGTTTDRSFFMTRTEVHCARCGGHLGHVFPDGPPPTGQRFCMNGVAMRFEPEAVDRPESSTDTSLAFSRAGRGIFPACFGSSVPMRRAPSRLSRAVGLRPRGLAGPPGPISIYVLNCADASISVLESTTAGGGAPHPGAAGGAPPHRSRLTGAS